MIVRLFVVLAVVLSCAATSVPSHATEEGGEDDLGTWFIWNGTPRFSEHWALFTEAQLRLYEPVSNPQEWFIRVAPRYIVDRDLLFEAGYLYSQSWPFDEAGNDSLLQTENRLYQQVTLHHDYRRSSIEHRYRYEQRWRTRDGDTSFSTRFRYRLQVTAPLNRKKMEPGAFFINANNELFVTLGHPVEFDQNRLYAGLGYKITPLSNFQAGPMVQSRTNNNYLRLWLFYTHDFDLR